MVLGGWCFFNLYAILLLDNEHLSSLQLHLYALELEGFKIYEKQCVSPEKGQNYVLNGIIFHTNRLLYARNQKVDRDRLG